MKLRFLLLPLLGFAFITGCDRPDSTDADAPATEQATEEVAPGDAVAPEATVDDESVQVTLTEEPEAPAATAAPLPDPVAAVNGQPISRAEFESTLNEIFSSMGMQISMLPPDQLGMLYRQFVDDMITDKLIDQASASMEVTPEEVDTEINTIATQYGSPERFAEELEGSGQTMDEFKDRLAKLIRQRKWMEAQVGAVAEVPEAEVRTFYDENKTEFEQPDVVRASHILIRIDEDADEATIAAKQAQATELAAKAKDGADFSALATEFSEDPTAKQNAGDLSFFPKDRMVPEFAEAAFAQEVGSITDPVRTQFGWHVIKVTDRKEAQTLPFDEVKADIAEYLKESRQQQAVEGVIAGLRETAQVEIFIPQPAMPQMDMQIQGIDAVFPTEE